MRGQLQELSEFANGGDKVQKEILAIINRQKEAMLGKVLSHLHSKHGFISLGEVSLIEAQNDFGFTLPISVEYKGNKVADVNSSVEFSHDVASVTMSITIKYTLL